MTDITMERLHELLNQKDQEIESLTHLVEGLEAQAEANNYEEKWRWRHIRKIAPGEYDDHVEDRNHDLPVPRLELRWREDGEGWGEIVDYGLVYRHFLGTVLFVPLGSTSIGTYVGDRDPESADQLEMPFRDGAHAQHDAPQLGLPLYLVHERTGLVRQVDLTEKDA